MLGPYFSPWCGALHSASPQKTTNFGFCMIQKAPFQALDFDMKSMTPDPFKAHKNMTESAVVCIGNYSKQIGFNC